MKKTSAQPLSQAEINAFGKKLSDWAASLPSDQRSIAQLLVSQVRDLTPQRVALEKITIDLQAAAKGVISALEGPIKRDDYWMEVGPIWQQRNDVEHGGDVEKIEIVQRIFSRMKRGK